MKERSRDTTKTIISSIVIGIVVGLIALTNMEFKFAAIAILGIAGGLFTSTFIAVFGVQESQEGTSESLKQNWKPIYLSLCTYICPIVAVITGLIIK